MTMVALGRSAPSLWPKCGRYVARTTDLRSMCPFQPAPHQRKGRQAALKARRFTRERCRFAGWVLPVQEEAYPCVELATCPATPLRHSVIVPVAERAFGRSIRVDPAQSPSFEF